MNNHTVDRFFVIFAFLMLISAAGAQSSEDEAAVSAEATAEVERADPSFGEKLARHCESHNLGDCEDGVGLLKLPYTLIHYLLVG